MKRIGDYKMTHIRVDEDVREKLNVLKIVMMKKNINDVIIHLMMIRQYDEVNTERIREKKGLI